MSESRTPREPRTPRESRRAHPTLAPGPADQVDEEIAFHLDARTEQLVAEGLSPEEARAKAEEEFGPLDGARADMIRRTRRRRRGAFAGDLARDVRYALRGVRARPGVFLVAALSIALGMAAVSTMWTALDRLILRPLPYDLERTLVYVGPIEQGRGGPSWPMSAADFVDLRRAARTVELAAYQEGGASLGGDTPEWVSIRRATPGFFSVLTVEPVLGRRFLDTDADGARRAALLSHGFWQRRYGADPDIVGQTISLDGTRATIVGVLPRGFALGRESTDLWLSFDPGYPEAREDRSVIVMGRMRSELTSVREELSELSQRLAEEHPASNAERRFVANTVIGEISSGPTATQGMGSSLAAALFVLLIACANVANLLLARGADRADEIALRRALGAGRGRIVWGLLVEAVLIAVVGGAAGVALSALGVRGLVALTTSTQQIPRMGELAVDARSMAVGMAMALGSVVIFGVVPALRTLVTGERRRLLRGTRGTPSGRGGHSAVLVAVEVGLAVVLIGTTALVSRSFASLQAVDTGFADEEVWSFRVTLAENAYPDDTSLRAGTEALGRAIAGVPGVSATGLAIGLPGTGIRSVRYVPPGGDPDAAPSVWARVADERYFDALDLRPLAGRGIGHADDAEADPVALVNEAFGRALWAEEDPIGRTLDVQGRTVQIVGVLPDVREMGAGSTPRSTLYLPLAQWPGRTVSAVVASTSGEPPIPELRRAVAALDGSPALRDVRPLRDAVLLSAASTRGLALLLGAMAGVALLLATIGVYAATSYHVVRRVPELGLRMALGADALRLRRDVLRRTLMVVGSGLAVGLPVAWAAGRGMSRFVLGSTGNEPTLYVAVTALLVCVSLAAAWTPARRAASVDPARSLRAE